MQALFRLFTLLFCSTLLAQVPLKYNESAFKQLKEELATPNRYRNAAGMPSVGYYQNTADYDMKVVLDEERQELRGKEEISYTNYSPDTLYYLWMQLDQNVRAQFSESQLMANTSKSSLNTWSYDRLHNTFDGGFRIEKVTSLADDNPCTHTIEKTMMRIDMKSPLAPGDTYTFAVDWWYPINNRMEIGGRAGYEYLKEEDNYIFTIAQFFPRMCVYNDVEGWQNKQFLGSGEFTLPFGDYSVEITVPEHHILTATGTLQNAGDVLSEKQISRWEEAQTNFAKPEYIVTPKEAERNASRAAEGTKTWKFHANNVRDFAFASSNTFMWDALAVQLETKQVMAMSFFPKQGNPLWEKYSTHAVAQTLETYSKHTFDYPYPVAISVHTHQIGMEYPMICFNGGRPEADGTYSARTKYGLISVVIHEVGHNYFPMIINSDERQWTWMDEGLNTFLQYLTEKEWDTDYPSRRGPARKIVNYMKGDQSNIMPIMTNSESILQFGNNAYGKPATALNILRETVMGRESFDYAFKQYARRWMFKHPTPADFFRIMEDASAIDLDWFWRGWFFSSNPVDISLAEVNQFQITPKNPEHTERIQKEARAEILEATKEERRHNTKTRVERYPELNDFYNTYDPLDSSEKAMEIYEKSKEGWTETQQTMSKDKRWYVEVNLENKGGLVMPVILKIVFANGKEEIRKYPAEIWVSDNSKATKLLFFDEKVSSIELDPYLETADIDRSNNYWPKRYIESPFEIEMKSRSKRTNPMQEARN